MWLHWKWYNSMGISLNWDTHCKQSTNFREPISHVLSLSYGGGFLSFSCYIFYLSEMLSLSARDSINKLCELLLYYCRLYVFVYGTVLYWTVYCVYYCTCIIGSVLCGYVTNQAMSTQKHLLKIAQPIKVQKYL